MFRLQIKGKEPTLKEKNDSELNSLLKCFWDLESIGIISTALQLTQEDKLAWDKVNKSLKFNGQHYEVAVPWRDERPQLLNNLPMAKKRLMSTERKLMKDKEVAVSYQQVLNDYLDKKYIRLVPADELKPDCEWLLPHFPVVRPEKATSKVRIVFDGSAPFEGKSLNTEALTDLSFKATFSISSSSLEKNGWLSSETSVKCTTSLYYARSVRSLPGRSMQKSTKVCTNWQRQQ